MSKDQEEIDFLREHLQTKEAQLDAYREQVKYLNHKISYLESSIKVFTEAQSLLSRVGENPLDYEMEHFDG